MSLTWNDLFLRGSVVSLSTKQWRARLAIKPADLGIDDTESVNKALVLGGHRLAPAEKFAAINEAANKARRAVDHHSLTFGFIFGARYVPSNALKLLTEKLETIRGEFYDAVSDFLQEYEAIKEGMLPVIEQALKDAARTPEAAANAIARVRSEYPPANIVRTKFALSWNIYAIQGPKARGTEDVLASEGAKVQDVVRDMVSQLRTEVTERLGGVLVLIQKGGTLKSNTRDAALATLDRVEAVNILGDETLAKQLKALRSAITSIEPGQRVSDVTVAGLDNIKSALETSIDDAVKAAEANLTNMGRRRLVA